MPWFTKNPGNPGKAKMKECHRTGIYLQYSIPGGFTVFNYERDQWEAHQNGVLGGYTVYHPVVGGVGFNIQCYGDGTSERDRMLAQGRLWNCVKCGVRFVTPRRYDGHAGTAHCKAHRR